MTALDFNVEKFINRQEIVQVLRLAIDKRWRFSYLSAVGRKVIFHPVSLLTVNAAEGTFSIDREIDSTGRDSNAPVMFRGQRGGLSILFQSRIGASTKILAADGLHSACDVELPYEVRCTQLRKSVRVDARAWADAVPVTLYLAMGYRLHGMLVDLSVCGAQIRIEGNHSERLKVLQVLEACRMELPDQFVLHAGLQLMGLNYIEQDDASFINCQFDEMSVEDEEKLDTFMVRALNDSAMAVLA